MIWAGYLSYLVLRAHWPALKTIDQHKLFHKTIQFIDAVSGAETFPLRSLEDQVSL